MRCNKSALATLLVVSLASLAYARMPARGAAPAPGELVNGYGAASAQQDEAKPPKQDESKPPKAEKQEMPGKQQKAEKDQKQDKNQAKQEQKQDKQQAGNHGRIPDDQFKSHFGQTHTFTVKRVVTTTHVVPNQTRFVYSGYTFVFVDPWPVGWSLDDDCYIDYVDGGYFIIDAVHPGMRVALMIAG